MLCLLQNQATSCLRWYLTYTLTCHESMTTPSMPWDILSYVSIVHISSHTSVLWSCASCLCWCFWRVDSPAMIVHQWFCPNSSFRRDLLIEAWTESQVASTSGEQHNFEAVLLINTQGKKNAPTVLTPHGGPHSVFPTSFLMSNLYFNILGYNVLQVNYR